MSIARRLGGLLLVVLLVLALMASMTPAVLADQNSEEGSFNVFVLKDGDWQLQGELSFSDYETLQLQLDHHSGQLILRLEQHGHDGAYVDYVALEKDDTIYLPVSAVNTNSGIDVLTKVLSSEYDVCDAWDSTMEINWEKVPADATLVMQAMEEDLGPGHGGPFYYPSVQESNLLTYALVNDGDITLDGVLEETGEPDFSVFWQPDTAHPAGYIYGWLHSDKGYLYAVVEVTPDNTLDEEDWGALYVAVDGELEEFRITHGDNNWGKAGFQYTSSVPYEHRVYEFQIPQSEINASIGAEVQFAFGCYGTAAETPDEVWVDDDYCIDPNEDTDDDAYFCSIQAAADAVAPGGTVYVAAGTYEEGDISIGKPLTLIGEGCSLTSVNATGCSRGFSLTSDDVIIKGFSIHGAVTGGVGSAGIVLDGVENCNIIDNCIYENGGGIELWSSPVNRISGNIIHHNQAGGISLFYDSSKNVIAGNDVYSNLNQWSCPFLYSWDGQDYLLDSQLFASARGTKTYYDKLEYLDSVDRKYIVKITEEMYETAFVDELKLVTVDHPTGTQIAIERTGNIHTIRSPYAPASAIEEDGTDCLDKVKDSDGDFWSGNMDNKDFSLDDDVRDGIILTFDKPACADTAKVVFRLKNTSLFEQVNQIMRSLPDDPSGATDDLRRTVIRPYLEVWDEGVMVYREMLSNAGSYVDREDVRVIDISGISTNELTIKLESLTGLLTVDSVMVDYSADEPVYITELPVVTAVDGKGTDITLQLVADDDIEYVMEQGDYAELSFNEPTAIAGHERTCLIEGDGYYYSPYISNIASETNRDLMEDFLADPVYAMRYSLENVLERDLHCGISIYYANFNKISGNRIHWDAGDGIELYMSHNNDIIKNDIWGNVNSGIVINDSYNNEIYCNDIYENGETNLTGIHLNSGSWGNVINYNNIYDNVWGVVNENSGEMVDATYNWWGASDGPVTPSNGGGGDKVNEYVDYDHWLNEECTECPYCFPWVEGYPYKMHWPQLPDTEAGLAIESNYDVVVADDFQCAETGPITDIHIWGGWLTEEADGINPDAVFEVCIFLNDPEGPGGWSVPAEDEPAWCHIFGPDEYNTTLFYEKNEDDVTFWSPWDDDYFGDCSDIYQYDFCIDPEEAFQQEEGEIYWLSVREIGSEEDDYYWGWLTAWPWDEFEDDAVTIDMQSGEPYWDDLWYPEGHPAWVAGFGSIPMAFVITGEPRCPPWQEGDPYKMHSPQLPDLDTGQVFESSSNEEGMSEMADDFECAETGLITDIHVWGGWICDDVCDEAEFWIGIFDDIPADESPTGYSMPGELAWDETFSREGYTKIFWGNLFAEDSISDHYYPTKTEPYGTLWEREDCSGIYQYNFCIDPEEAFMQKAGNTYWLSVVMTYADDDNWGDDGMWWGWLSSLDAWNDDAAWRYSEEVDSIGWRELYYLELVGDYYSPSEDSADLAFVITGLPTGAIGDTIFYDDDDNGVQDPGESGISGVVVQLYQESDGIPGLDTANTDTLIDETTSDDNGFYLFDGLETGVCYWVLVVEETLPEGFVLTTGSNPIGEICLEQGEKYDGADFGYRPAPTPTPPPPPPTPEPPAIAVGGEICPVNKVALIVTWIALAMIVAAGGFHLVRRRVLVSK
jgi:parallel beta-helix repeat protein